MAQNDHVQQLPPCGAVMTELRFMFPLLLRLCIQHKFHESAIFWARLLGTQIDTCVRTAYVHS